MESAPVQATALTTPYQDNMHARYDGIPTYNPRESVGHGFGVDRYHPGAAGVGAGTGVDFRSSKASFTSSRTSLSWATAETPTTRRSSTLSQVTDCSNGASLASGLTRPMPLSQRSSFALPRRDSVPPTGPHAVDRLPQEVLDNVIEQLKVVHADPLLASCTTCYLRDLHSMCMISKTWRRAARPKMYRSIWLVGNDSVVHVRKKFKMKHGARLKLLRRTLRENLVIAQLVRELKVPDIVDSQSSPAAAAERAKYVDLVASVVMACPNLERLVGFYNKYDHNFDRLSYALSTRTKLREHVWVITASPTKAPSRLLGRQAVPATLQPEQANDFLHHHVMWRRLETLFVHRTSAGVLHHELLIGALTRLPALKNLFVSNLDAADFDDISLQSLPELQSLRLQNLRGVTERGIGRYASSPAARSLSQLSLLHLEIVGLSVISKLLSSLLALKRFTLVQQACPELPWGEIVFQPIIASTSLEYLHWDVLQAGSANDHLASSIQAGGFPRLRVLRAPSDHDGCLQAECRPLEQVTISSDKYSFMNRHTASAGQSPTSPHAPQLSLTPRRRTLFAARQAAQARLEQARSGISFRIIIDEDGAIKQVFKIPGFIGAIGSNITYTLTPDVHGSDTAVIDLPDLLDSSREIDARDGCTGVWNSIHPAGKKWWSHTERCRYRRVELARFF
ncbi:MAG: hypothetical protein M1838_002595 [Thelocarpon superellum]|nr:MAG: hypothetical protein M1838_002595 [Thelocarpon superellum]